MAPASESAKAVANEFLKIADEAGKTITPMKLQKLVYFAHGWKLGITGEPLIREDIEAWQYGPVVRSLYHEFKEFSLSDIDKRATELEITDIEKFSMHLYEPELQDEDARNLVRRIWDVYGDYTATKLSNMTHEPGTPWHAIAKRYQREADLGEEVPKGTPIPNELIGSYFANKV
ncbi:MAG: hypothetical protein Phyf2KO_14080 [Phycisphaerales bacterium]